MCNKSQSPTCSHDQEMIEDLVQSYTETGHIKDTTTLGSYTLIFPWLSDSCMIETWTRYDSTDPWRELSVQRKDSVVTFPNPIHSASPKYFDWLIIGSCQ